MISFCLVVVSAGLTSFLISCFQSQRNNGLKVSSVGSYHGLFVIASVLLVYLQGHAVVGAMEGLLFSASVLGYSGYLHRQARRNQSLIAPGSLFIALALAAVLFYTLLAEKHTRRIVREFRCLLRNFKACRQLADVCHR